MKQKIRIALGCGLGALACVQAFAQSFANDIIVADGFPAIGHTQSGENPDMGGWTSNQGRGIVDSSPFGSVANPRVGFAAWDFFAESTFTGLAKQYYGKGANLNATLSQYEEDSMWSSTITPDNGSLLDNGLGGRLSSSPLDFSISASLSQPVHSVVLQLKHTTLMDDGWTEVLIPFVDATLVVGGQSLVYDSVFAPYMAEGGQSLPPSEGGTTTIYWVTEFHWTGVDIQAFEQFELNFSQANSYFSIDTVALYTLSVPEPSTYALILSAVALSGIVLLRRRKASAA